VSKFWNICIDGHSNIGSWPNISENIGIGFKNMMSVGLYYIPTKVKVPPSTFFMLTSDEKAM